MRPHDFQVELAMVMVLAGSPGRFGELFISYGNLIVGV